MLVIAVRNGLPFGNKNGLFSTVNVIEKDIKFFRYFHVGSNNLKLDILLLKFFLGKLDPAVGPICSRNSHKPENYDIFELDFRKIIFKVI